VSLHCFSFHACSFARSSRTIRSYGRPLVNMSSSLPPMLLGSAALTLQSDLSVPKFSNIGKARRSASTMTSHGSIVGDQMGKDITTVPMYCRFDTYEYRANLCPEVNVLLGHTQSEARSGQTEMIKFTLVPHEHSHKTPARETEKAKGKKRSFASENINTPVVASSDHDTIDDDHLAPFRPKSSSKPYPSSFAGPSNSLSHSPRTPNPPSISCLQPSSLLHCDSGRMPLSNAPLVLTPPSASHQIPVPSSRSQATGRSILKRVDNLPSPEMQATGVPMYDRIHIDSLRGSSSRAVRRNLGVKNGRASGDFENVDLSSADSQDDRRGEPRFLAGNERVGRHWSVIGERWMRKSGIFTRG
jgi:hypothetical protein